MMRSRARRRSVRRSIARCAVALGLAAASAGCYKYTYVDRSEAAVGDNVRVHLSQAGYQRLAASVGDQVPGLRRTFDGSLVGASVDRLLVAVHFSGDARVSSQGLEQRVSVPMADVQRLELKQLDKKRVIIIGAGAGVVLGALIVHYVGGEFGGTTGKFPEQGPSELMAPRP
jgi:hypothetical protein